MNAMWTAVTHAGTGSSAAAAASRPPARRRRAPAARPARPRTPAGTRRSRPASSTTMASDGAPAEVPDMNAQVPVPRARDHQHRRRGEVRQRAANRDVDEQQSQRRVLQARGSAEIVELPRQQQRADRHRRRLGDERARAAARSSGSTPTTRPACRRRACATPPQRRLGERDDRPRGRQRHDHDDEQRLGVVDGVVEVVRRGAPTRRTPTIATSSTIAQRPKTTSTSPRKCRTSAATLGVAAGLRARRARRAGAAAGAHVGRSAPRQTCAGSPGKRSTVAIALKGSIVDALEQDLDEWVRCRDRDKTRALWEGRTTLEPATSAYDASRRPGADVVAMLDGITQTCPSPQCPVRAERMMT